MMKFFITVLLSMVVVSACTAQISKVYITNQGAFSDDPSNASSYITIEKFQDTAYLVDQYSMANVLLVKGVYKDKLLTTPNGKFSYYTVKTVNSSSNNQTYMNSCGYFTNGVKSGNWIEFHSNGNKAKEYKYVNNKANGEYREFYEDGITVMIDGMYVNDKKEGEWKEYSMFSTKPAKTIMFSDGEMIKQIDHYKPSEFGDDFYRSVKRSLGTYFDTLLNRNFQAVLFVNEKGKIDSVKLKYEIDKVISDAIVKAFLNAPNLKYATIDNEPVKDIYPFEFGEFRKNNRSDGLSQRASQHHMDVWSRHANDIGRGLNTVGIGKPVN